MSSASLRPGRQDPPPKTQPPSPDAADALAVSDGTTNDITKIEASNSLADLRERLKIEDAAVTASLKDGLTHAMAAGEILIVAKSNGQLKHGEWLPWLESCGIAERKAQRYMRLARNRAAIEANPTPLSDLGISGAFGLLTVCRDTQKGGMTNLTVGLADRTVDVAFDFSEFEHLTTETHRIESEALEALRSEALAAIDKAEELIKSALSSAPQLDQILASEVEGADDLIVAGVAEYKAAAAAELGLTVENLDELQAAIDDLKRQGADQDTITWSLAPDVIRMQSEPDTGARPLATFSSKVRDVCIDTLHRVERIIASGAAG
jgi:hypothetical protein